MPLKILLIEDALEERRALRRMLEDDAALKPYRLQFCEAGDGEEGLACYERERPDLVIADLLLPKIDGFVLCQKIRQRDDDGDLPIIAVSGVYRDQGAIIRMRDELGVEVMGKPIDYRKLSRRISSALSRRRAARPDAAARWSVDRERGPTGAGRGLSRGPEARVTPTPGAGGSEPTLSFDSAQRGTLDQHPLGWLLVQAAADEATGALKLISGRLRKVIYLLKGRPIYVDSNLRHETLGAYLVAQEVIDEAGLTRAMRHARVSGQKLGQALIALGLATGAQVDNGLFAQTQIKLISALRWSSGTFTFTPGDDFSGRVPSCPVDAVRLTLGALRRLMRADQLGDAQGALLAGPLVLTRAGQRFRSAIDAVFGTQLLERAEGGVKLGEIVGDKLNMAEALVQLEAMRVVGLATVQPPEPGPLDERGDDGPRSIELDDRSTGTPPAMGLDLEHLDPTRAPASSEVRAAPAAPIDLELVEPGKADSAPEIYADSGMVTLPTVDDLELEERDGASLPPTVAGGEGVTSTAVVEQRPTADALQARATAESLDVAPEPPGASPAPAQPDAAPAQPDPAPAAAQEPEVDPGEIGRALQEQYEGLYQRSYYEILGVSPAASSGEIELAYRRLQQRFSTGQFAKVDMPQIEDTRVEFGMMLEQASMVLLDPVSRHAYDQRLATAQPQQSASVDSFGAELFFQDGRNRLREGDVAGAVEALGQAVEQNNEQPDYHAFFGWALFLQHGRGGAGAQAAQPHLERALQIAPDSAQAHELAAKVALDVRDYRVAADHLHSSLRHGPPRQDLFEQLKAALQQLGDHGQLEREYRNLIFRLRDTEPGRTVSLWVGLAFLYHEKLARPQDAALALDVARRLAPKDPEVQAAQATIAAAKTVSWEQVCEGHRQRLRAQPDLLLPLHELFSMHQSGLRPDEMFTVAAILVGRHGATAEQKQTYTELRPAALLRARTALSPLLAEARHEDDHPGIEQVVGQLNQALVESYPTDVREVGGEQTVALAEGDLPQPFAAVLRYVCIQLNQLPPTIFRAPQVVWAIPVPGAEAELAVGPRLLQSRDEAQIAFAVGRALSCITPGRRHAFARRAGQLKVAFLAALVRCRGVEVPDADGEIARFGARLSEERVEQLKRLFDEEIRSNRLNLSAWMRGVRCSASRVGLLLGGDPRPALEVIGDDGHVRADLVDFALGPSYRRARRSLGLSVAD